jgi:ribonuclease VapC
MILDTSAIVAIFLQEPEHEELVDAMASAAAVGIGAPTLVETGIVLSARLGRDARGSLARFLAEGGVAVVPFGDAHYSAAVDAWLRYGKGRHPAGLNFGDCLSYATALLTGRPLLCVGGDFARTDLALVIPAG